MTRRSDAQGSLFDASPRRFGCSVPCASCGVTADTMCRTRAGNDRRTVHEQRITDAREHWKQVASGELADDAGFLDLDAWDDVLVKDAQLAKRAALDAAADAVAWERYLREGTRDSKRLRPSTRAHFRAPDVLDYRDDELIEPSRVGSAYLRVGPRRRVRMVRTNAAARAVEPLLAELEADPGTAADLNMVTTGEFSLLDVVLVLLEWAGPSNVAIMTWSAGVYDMEVMNRFVNTKLIRSLRLILDVSFRNNRGNQAGDGTQYASLLEDVFGTDAIRTVKTHAKFVTITGGMHEFSISGSPNLNENQRLETLQVSTDPELAAFYRRVADEVFDDVEPGWHPDTGVNTLQRIDPTASKVTAGQLSGLGTVTVGGTP